MPNIPVEYSPNVRAEADTQGLLTRIASTVQTEGLFTLEGVRVRAAVYENCMVGGRSPARLRPDRRQGGQRAERRLAPLERRKCGSS
jgi:hypothetical protein